MFLPLYGKEGMQFLRQVDKPLIFVLCCSDLYACCVNSKIYLLSAYREHFTSGPPAEIIGERKRRA